MAWLMGDGFDFYKGTAIADTIAPGSMWSYEYGVGTSINVSRYGVGQGLFIGDYNNIVSNPFTSSTTVWLNFAFYTNGGSGNGGFRPNSGITNTAGFELYDTTLSAPQCTFGIRQNGDICIQSGVANGGGVLATSSVIPELVNFAWNHFQVKIVISNGSGTIDVRMNGELTPVWSASGLNTRHGTGNNTCNIIKINTPNAAFYGCGVDDFYMFNDQGAQPNTWQGDVRAVQSMPNADQSITWTPNVGTNNYSRVNEIKEDGDTSYVYSNTPGNTELYSVAPIPTAYPVICVQPKMCYRMDDAGPHYTTLQLKSGSTTVTGPSGTALSSYSWIQVPYVTDPNTSAAWTTAAVNACQIGSVNLA